MAGQQLTSKGGVFSLSLTSQGLFSYINSNPPQGYFFYNPGIDNISYVQFLNRSLAFFNQSFKLFSELEMVSTSSALQYMRFEPDGHLRVYYEDWTQWYESLHIILMMVIVVTLRFVAIIVFVQTASVFVLHPLMEQTIFGKLMKCCLILDAPWLLPCLVKLPKITFF